MIKIGIDNFHDNGTPIDNCNLFRLDENDGWDEYPCDTGFVIQWFVQDEKIHKRKPRPNRFINKGWYPAQYRYVDTRKENYFLYPINFKCFINGFNITIGECWGTDKQHLKTKRTFLDSIPNHVLEKVRNNKAKILLNYGYEGYDENTKDTILYLSDLLIEKLQDKKIPIENVFYTDGNYQLDNNHAVIKSFSQNYTANCFYIEEGEVGSNLSHFKLTEEQIDKKKNVKLEKKYICYNRLHKPHREQVVNWIKEKQYLEEGYVSFPPDLILDYTNFDDNWAYHKICHQHYDTSFFSIVNESQFGSYTHTFLTEKTWKAIFNFHPFVIVGSPNSLRYLKERGFDTFEDIFDSSYDSIIDEDKRLEKILLTLDNFFKNNNIKKLHKLRNDIYDRLLHNYNHFWDDFRDYVVEDFNNKIEDIMK